MIVLKSAAAWLVFSAQDGTKFEPPPITVPDGFTIEVVAAPPLVRHPMMAGFDERGRLFIAESDGQNLQKDELLKQLPRFIRVLEDTDGDGKFDRSGVFADRMVMPEGALWHEGALFVVSSPYLWRLEDADGNGVAEKRERLVGTMEFDGRPNQHGPYLGPEGRLYFSGGTFGYDLVGKDGKRAGQSRAAGLFSCRADGTDVEIVGHSGINPVEVVFSEEGEAFSTCAIFDGVGGRHDALVHWIPGGVYGPHSYGVPTVKQTGFRLPAAHRWGQVAPAGLARYRGTAFGAEYRDNLFACHFNTHKVVRLKLEPQGSTFRARDEDFVSSPSNDFHPADVLEDADGSLLLIDTGGWLSWGCPTSKIAKPNVFGAIYRIRKAGAARDDDPRGLKLRWEGAGPAELVERLDDPRPAVRDRSTAALARLGNGALPALRDARVRREAAWALCRIGTPEAAAVLRGALEDKADSVRHAAVQGAGTLRDKGAVSALVKILAADTPAIRRAAAAALGRIGEAGSVGALLESLRQEGDDHFRHSVVYALIRIGDRAGCLAGLTDPSPAVRHGALVALDQMDGGDLKPQQVAHHLDPSNPALQQAALRIISARPAWAGEVLEFVSRELARESLDEGRHQELKGVLVAFSGQAAIQDLMARTLRQENAPAGARRVVLEAMAQSRPAKVPAVWVAEMRWSLDHPDERVARQAVATIRAAGVTELDEPLGRVTRDSSKSPDTRAEAAAAVAPRLSSVDSALFAFLLACLEPEKPPLLRMTAAQALGAARLSDEQLTRLAPRLSTLGALELPKVIGAYGRSGGPKVGEPFVAGLEKSSLVESLSSADLRQILGRYPEEVRRRAQPLLRRTEADLEKQKARLDDLSANLGPGQAGRGKAVYFGNRAACSACHRAEGQGGLVGPDLSRIGQIRTRRDLLESIVFPSSTLVNGYETYRVKTQDGSVHEGLIARETSEAIFLTSADRVEKRVLRSSVAEILNSRLSIMPQGLDAQLSREELADLVAYLLSLK